MRNSSLSVFLAREALRGFFGDPYGFREMTVGTRRLSVRRIAGALTDTRFVFVGHWTEWLALAIIVGQ